MKKLLICVILFLSACQEAPNSDEPPLLDTDAEAGIVGGQTILAKDSLSRIVFSLLSTYPDKAGPGPDGVMTELTDMGYQCTASALTQRIAITAAHCVEDKHLKHRLEITDKDGKKIINKVIKFIIHPEFKNDERADIAILLMEKNFPEDTIYPEIPQRDDYLDLRDLIGAGFGRVTGEKLREGRAGILRAGFMEAKSYHPSEPTFMIDQNHGHGICSGDSGGPSYIKTDDKKLMLVGIAYKVTFYRFEGDENPDTCNNTGSYANVQFHVDWILATAKALFKKI